MDAAAQILQASMDAYRSLVYETPGFAEYFCDATPIREIAKLNIGSRPASRKASQRIEDLGYPLGISLVSVPFHTSWMIWFWFCGREFLKAAQGCR